MQRIARSEHIRKTEELLVSSGKISPYELMEKACDGITQAFIQRFPQKIPVHIFCGRANNGGDGLGLARRLHLKNYPISCYIVGGSPQTPESQKQLNTYQLQTQKKLIEITQVQDFPDLPQGQEAILVDALLGSGINRPLSGLLSQCVEYLNTQDKYRVAIDIPSGLHGEEPFPEGLFFHAHHIFFIEACRPSILYPSVASLLGDYTCIDIGLDIDGVSDSGPKLFFQTDKDFSKPLLKRPRFIHKGTVGRVGLIAGQEGMLGAALLAAEACLRSGIGTLTVQIPCAAKHLLHASLPEALWVYDDHPQFFTRSYLPKELKAIGVGPGLGTAFPSICGLRQLLRETQTPMVIDADALNILGLYPELWEDIPKGSILSPHEGEFEQCVGKSKTEKDGLDLLLKKSVQHGVVILLKGAYTRIACPDGKIIVNTTGDPAMATAGAGDVLTGIILGLLGQGLSSEWAARYATYLHGKAGEAAAQDKGNGLIARDLIKYLPRI
ncbi:MAG: NAD(P)H-hydrate dehydratase [Cytophagales bacterium]|nr:NAD(P)H-hydrate dehydratase [Cytophagales bacterium]